jgi:DNA-binding winged helix-turn-helix (wHTH) protein/tetratricopeptide (TPR) repeat protein
MEAVVTRAAESGALREHVMSLYVGVLAYAAGELREARVALESAYVHLEEHSDFVMASIAGYYLGRTMLAQGQVADAVSIFSEMAELAESAELYTLAPHGGASHADALLASGHIDEAREIARKVLESRELRTDGRWIAQCVVARSYALEGELEAAIEHHETAIADAPADLHGAYAAAGKLERAALELMGGDPSVVIEAAEAAREHYGRVGRKWMEARSCVTLAAGLVARGGTADLVTAEGPLARAEKLTAEYTYPRVAARCALVRAALVRREGDSARAREHLVGALRGLDVRANRPEVAGLRAALQRADEGDMPPGVRAVISMLGLTSGPRYVIIDKGGTRAVSEAEVAAERDNHDVVVEPARAVITVERGARSDRGRPMSCELLARLIEGRGSVVAAEDLFRDVWGGREYHPLRHRNTVYVAVRRLRQTLRKLLGERDVIETASGGWRIADGVDAATIRPAE